MEIKVHGCFLVGSRCPQEPHHHQPKGKTLHYFTVNGKEKQPAIASWQKKMAKVGKMQFKSKSYLQQGGKCKTPYFSQARIMTLCLQLSLGIVKKLRT